MASEWPNNPDKLNNSMFWSMVGGAEKGGRGAVNMWSSLRTAAENWATSVLNVSQPTGYTQADVQAKVSQLIGHVTIQDVNRYAKTVGEFLRAKSNLQSLGMDYQITGQAIFTPPWSRTAGNPAIPTRYRIRVYRQIEVRGFTRITRQEWGTYELTGPLTTMADALNQANRLFSEAEYNKNVSITSILDYSIEAI